ncbi:anaerobic ribonucleoside-triphosphate reductase activating protein [Pseudidiomarina aestuarii]|uniref:anaerobic ribonucleoside-triphosphate reductase activating protein n=1 Tax=Pseudidiomarina aestuarii TaxID=624146 RepID=UPI003A985B21
MRFSAEAVVFQEVPGEVALAYTITGCPIGCKGCHSADSWSADRGHPLTASHLQQQFDRYQGLITAVLFLGGEWYSQDLTYFLNMAKQRGLATCLYTGLVDVDDGLKKHLDYLKTGPWVAERGGLMSPKTNQRFYDLRSGKVLNALFCPEFIELNKEGQNAALTSRSTR